MATAAQSNGSNKVRRVSELSVGNAMLVEVQNTVRDRLAKYCENKLIESGISTASTAKDVRYHGMDSSVMRKSTLKLKALLQKHIVKSIPYLTFAHKEFITTVDRTNAVRIELGDITYRNELDADAKKQVVDAGYCTGNQFAYYLFNKSSIRSMYTNRLPEVKFAIRYIRYMNYLCRKYGVPLLFAYNASVEYHTDDPDTKEAINNFEKESNYVKHKLNLAITATMVQWIPENGRLYHEHEKNGFKDDKYFSDVGSWYTDNMTTVRDTRWGVENLFYHLTDIIRGLSNLSRKANYGYAAYRFRTA